MFGVKFILEFFILAVCLTYNVVQSQIVPPVDRDCYSDGIFYTSAGSYAVSKIDSSCKLSYIYSPFYQTQILSLEFNNVQIVCNGQNNLKIVDAQNAVYDYCARTFKPTQFFYGTFNTQYTTLIKRGNVRFTLRYNFLPINPTNPPLTTIPSVVSTATTTFTTTVTTSTASTSTTTTTTSIPTTSATTATASTTTTTTTTTTVQTTPTTTTITVQTTPTTTTIVAFTTPTTTIAFVTITIPTTTVTTASTSACGVSASQYPPNETGLSRIVGGFTANQHSWPWQAFITDNNFQCGASLINNQWLVTAAHCNFNLNTFQAYLGDHFTGTGNTRIAVQRFIPHPSYSDSNDGYDIALIKLQTPVTYSDTIKPVCLPASSQTASFGQRGIVTGWGVTTENGNVPNALQQVQISVRSSSDCYNSGIYNFNSAISICAGETSPSVHDSCQGDSGGPFVMKNTDNSYYLAGIVSSGVGCRGNGVYVRVSAFRSWIDSTIASN